MSFNSTLSSVSSHIIKRTMFVLFHQVWRVEVGRGGDVREWRYGNQSWPLTSTLTYKIGSWAHNWSPGPLCIQKAGNLSKFHSDSQIGDASRRRKKVFFFHCNCCQILIFKACSDWNKGWWSEVREKYRRPHFYPF